MTHESDIYSSDSPVTNQSEDQFNRFPFAKQVASVITGRKDSSSIVIGIYGAWGEGKTSVLNFIEGELSQEEQVVCIRFNPWRFGEEDEMLVNFFNDLAKAIEKSIETGKEKFRKVIDDYIKPAMSMMGQSQIAEGASSFFSNAGIEEVRTRIEEALEEEKKRVVILIDDIDRLEKNEIHFVFRLVKLTADFKYTAYILAFDQEMVSAALQERYSSGNQYAGKSFLEKIIQVPLHLPLIDSQDLKVYCFKGINDALSLSDIELPDEQIQLFVNNFARIEKLLRTPRQAMLYSNILTFSLPILKGEVNVVDLMLIEALRVFTPGLYEFIRENQDLFTGDVTIAGKRNDEEANKRKNRIRAVMKKSITENEEEIEKLLLYLFPKLNNVLDNTRYGSDWENAWSREQRVCSNYYFQRYFTYSIPRGDISDKFVNDLLFSNDCLISEEELIVKIKDILTPHNAENLISKLRSRIEKITKERAMILAPAISKLGNELPNPHTFLFANAYWHGAMLVGDMVEVMENRDDQIDLAIKVIQNGYPLSFAIDCFSWLRKDTETHPNPKGFTNQDFATIGECLASRISSELKRSQHIETPGLWQKIKIWSVFGDSQEMMSWLKQNLEEHPQMALEILEDYLPTTLSSSGVSRKSDFEREEYNSFVEIINPEDMKLAIEKDLGEVQIEPEYPIYAEIPFKEKLAKQFLWIHNFYREEK